MTKTTGRDSSPQLPALNAWWHQECNLSCCVWVSISEMNTTGTKMPQVYVGRFFEPASFSTGFHGKLSSSSANSAHFGKTNKLRENQENLDNRFFSVHKKQRVWGMGGKSSRSSRWGWGKACLVQPSLPGTWGVENLSHLPAHLHFHPVWHWLSSPQRSCWQPVAATIPLHTLLPISFHTPVVPGALSCF